MANEVIKVYNTKQNALLNGTTGYFEPVTVTSNVIDQAGSTSAVAVETIANSEAAAATSGTNAGPYYIYNKYYYRFEANEPVTEFHIDWDEGEDNSPEKSSIEIIKLESPAFSAVTEHIFTEHKQFFPLIRTKNTDGFLSKWYTNDVAGSLSELEETTVAAGQNEFSVLSREKAGSDRIPGFFPANLPPVSVLKADRKRIYSGIDNEAIKSTFNYPLLYAIVVTPTGSAASTKPDIKFTIQNASGAELGGATQQHTLAGANILTDVDSWTHSGTSSKLYVNCIPAKNNSSGTTKTSAVEKVLRVELDNAKELNDTDRVYINVFDAASNLQTSPSLTTDKTVAILSNGNPIVDLSDPYYMVNLDGNESRMIASNNASTSTFYFDDDKLYITGEVQGADADDVSDVLASGGASKVVDGKALIGYSFGYLDSPLDSDYRFLPTSRLCRIQALNGDHSPGSSSERVDILSRGRIESFNTTVGIPEDDVDHTTHEGFDISAHPFSDDDAVTYYNPVGSNPVAPLVDETTYYVVGATTNFFQVAATSGGTRIALTSDGTAGQYFSRENTALSHKFPSSLEQKALILHAKYTDTTRTNLKWLNKAEANRADNVAVMGAGENATSLITGGGHATATITITDYTELNSGDKVNLVATDGTNYDFTNGDQSSVNGTWESTTSNNATASNLMNVINTSSGPSGTRFTATVSSAVVTVTQATLGVDGNTTVTLTDSGTAGMSKTDFTGGEDSAGAHPLNYILIANTEPFDRLHLRLNNTLGHAGYTDLGDVEISAYYTNGTSWVPLEIVDNTHGLLTSGTIKFNRPDDWASNETAAGIDSGTWKGPVGQDYVTSTGTEAPIDIWDFQAYGILLAFNATTADGVGSTSTKIQLMNIWPYNNSHSQSIDIVDPHHVSLNSIAIAQSISFGRSSKILSVEDKFGKADIRKIGASGGSVTFGGIDLGGSSDHRKTMVGYQKNATPVFIDITHKSDEITRFFGVINSVTEDYPAGNMYPKWAVNMQISYILEMSSTGVIASDKISIGGALVDDGKYIL